MSITLLILFVPFFALSPLSAHDTNKYDEFIKHDIELNNEYRKIYPRTNISEHDIIKIVNQLRMVKHSYLLTKDEKTKQAIKDYWQELSAFLLSQIQKQKMSEILLKKRK